MSNLPTTANGFFYRPPDGEQLIDATAIFQSFERVDARLGQVLYVTDPNYGALGDGVADDAPAIQSAFDAASLYGGTVILPVGKTGVYLCNEPLRLRANVNVICQGALIDSRSDTYSLYADEFLDSLVLDRLKVTHVNNPNIYVSGFVFKMGISHSRLWLDLTGKQGVTQNGVVLHGANPDTMLGSNNLKQNLCYFRISSQAEISGTGVQLGETTDIVNGLALANVVWGEIGGFSTGVFINGQSNTFQAGIHSASVVGMIYQGSDCHDNEIRPPAFFGTGVTGDKIRMYNTDVTQPHVMARVLQCFGINGFADVTVVNSAYPALFEFNSKIYVSAFPSPGVASWPLGKEFTNSNRTEQGSPGSKYILDKWVVVSGGSGYLPCRVLTGN